MAYSGCPISTSSWTANLKYTVENFSINRINRIVVTTAQQNSITTQCFTFMTSNLKYTVISIALYWLCVECNTCSLLQNNSVILVQCFRILVQCCRILVEYQQNTGSMLQNTSRILVEYQFNAVEYYTSQHWAQDISCIVVTGLRMEPLFRWMAPCQLPHNAMLGSTVCIAWRPVGERIVMQQIPPEGSGREQHCTYCVCGNDVSLVCMIIRYTGSVHMADVL